MDFEGDLAKVKEEMMRTNMRAEVLYFIEGESYCC